MKIEKVQNKHLGSELAAELFIEKSNRFPKNPVGLATGETMRGVYEELAKRNFKPEFEDAFALDEYQGISKESPNSYWSELDQNFSQLLSWGGKLHVPGRDDYQGEHGLGDFENAISEKGPISVQLLGLGTNGHVAFNEPGSEFDSLTRVIELHSETRLANSRFFSSIDEVPKSAVTQGLATIAKAESLLLLVFGDAKKEALVSALENPSENTPLASLLDHKDLTLITDLEI